LEVDHNFLTARRAAVRSVIKRVHAAR
jgi:hypothetical protein